VITGRIGSDAADKGSETTRERLWAPASRNNSAGTVEGEGAVRENFRKRAGVALALATAVTTMTACASQGSSGSGSSDTKGSIKVAVVDAQSGQLSALGAWEYKGVKLAVNEANKAGGINGRKIALKLFDDQGDPTVGTNLARKLSSGGYVAMLGTAESAVTLAMAPVLKTASIPNITSGQSPKLAELGSPFLFLNGPTSVTYDETLAKYAADEKGMKKFALLTNNGGYGGGERGAFTAALKSRGITPVADSVVTPDAKDFSAVLTKIRQKNPDALFIGAEEVQAGLIAKQARELGVDAVFIGAAPLGTPTFVQTAGAQTVEGSIVSSPYLSNDANDKSKKFAAAYKAAYNEDAELHGAKAYDGAWIVIEGLKKTGGKGGKELADAMRAVKRDGLLGTFNFDDKGVGIQETSIGTIKGGKLEVVS
jgi:branched-chain amino acid transport system substrate-binding protein